MGKCGWRRPEAWSLEKELCIEGRSVFDSYMHWSKAYLMRFPQVADDG